MGKPTFKDNYIGYNGYSAIKEYDETFYYSPLGRGTGTRDNPANPKTVSRNSKLLSAHIFSGGYHAMTATLSATVTPAAGKVTERSFFGMGMSKTVLSLELITSANTSNLPAGATANIYFRDMKLLSRKYVNTGGWIPLAMFRYCDIASLASFNTTTNSIANCKLRYLWTGQHHVHGQNSYIACTGTVNSYMKSNNLFDKCNIAIIQSSLDAYSNYLAFNDCNFRIGSETNYTPLTPKDSGGNDIANPTEPQLRAEFVRRCTAQGLNTYNVTEYGQTNVKQGRWVFVKDCCHDGTVLKDTVIHTWEVLRNLAFGWTPNRPERMAITEEANIPATFAPQDVNKDVDLSNGSISLPSNFDITDRHEGYAYSKILYLGGKKRLTMLDVAHNLPLDYGMMLDCADTLSANPVTQIEAGETYLVRSTDKQPAEVVYNGVTYTTSLISGNNVFTGVDGQTTFTGTANRAVYKVLDVVMQQSVQMRIVNVLPPDKIKTGNLQAGYWYFVEPDNPDDTTGTVTYKGVVYPAYDSFLVKDVLSFTATANAHLCRCWRHDYDNPNTEVTDKTHWKFEQKPKWLDVLPDDLRCLKRYNNELEPEMLRDNDDENSNFNYYTSGHPDFYHKLFEDAGLRTPVYYLTGTYLQLRLRISTLNPM